MKDLDQLITTIRTSNRPVIGCDPGLRTTGLFLFGNNLHKDRCEFIDTLKNDTRMSLFVLSGAHGMIRPGKPLARNVTGLFCVEEVIYNRLNPKTTINHAYAVGSIIGGADPDYQLVMVNPRVAKKIMTGNGSASKTDMVEAARELFPQLAHFNRPKRECIADSIAIGLAGWANTFKEHDVHQEDVPATIVCQEPTCSS